MSIPKISKELCRDHRTIKKAEKTQSLFTSAEIFEKAGIEGINDAEYFVN